jgi:hypothetical protein
MTAVGVPPEVRLRAAAPIVILLLVASMPYVHGRGASIRSLPSINCSDGEVMLEVKPARVHVDHGFLSFTTRLYHVDGVAMFPGPTIRVQPGTSCTLRLKNSLPALNPNEQCTSMSEVSMVNMTMMHCADITNLHTHGTEPALAVQLELVVLLILFQGEVQVAP